MSREKGFVESDVFNAYNIGIGQRDDLVHQQEGIPMRQGLLNLLCGINGRLRGVVHRHIFQVLVLLDVLFDLFGESHIGAMSRPVGDDAHFYRITDQCEVAHNVQQLMPRGLVGETQLEVIQVAFVFNGNLIAAKGFGEAVHRVFGKRFVDHHNGIVDIAAFDQVVLQQHFEFV